MLTINIGNVFQYYTTAICNNASMYVCVSMYINSILAVLYELYLACLHMYTQAVYFYQPDGRGPCLAFEGVKLQLHWFRGYLVVVGKENKALPRAPVL